MIEITTTCPDSPLEDDPAVGFYIWIVETADTLASSISPAGICRYGTGEWNVAPACPLAACLDFRCNECQEWEDL